ncbi:MAG: IS630 family transposase [Sphingobacteriales bacterium]
MDRLSKTKINVIRRHYITGGLSGAKIAEALHIQRDTAYRYINEFKEIERLYPKKLKDFTFMLPKPAKPNPRYNELIAVFPRLIENAQTNVLEIVRLWEQYRILYPAGYHLYHFSRYFNSWKRENNVCRFHHRRVKALSSEDETEFNHWRNSKNIQLWRKAVVILDSYKCRPMLQISAQVEVSVPTMLVWIKRFTERGIKALEHKDFTPDPKKVASNKIKRENLLKLIQQTPKAFDVNRTAWSLTALSRTYEKEYHSPLGTHAISHHLRNMGYQFQKSRERLVSPDKHFREKMDRITSILANLKADEKFFSIDEYGPAVVNMKVGWSYAKENEPKILSTYLKKSKGWYILTAALELGTNQITHFYSTVKNTAETVKLIELLCEQYKGSRTLYISWDCASWHNSKLLKDRIIEINRKAYREIHHTPKVVLAPLPSSAQYLNVIESVFSGMAKSVIHNSDYGGLDECKSAIDRYFMERNQYYLENPQKAGKKIWGKENVLPQFNEANNCKTKLRHN